MFSLRATPILLFQESEDLLPALGNILRLRQGIGEAGHMMPEEVPQHLWPQAWHRSHRAEIITWPGAMCLLAATRQQRNGGLPGVLTCGSNLQTLLQPAEGDDEKALRMVELVFPSAQKERA